jgi:hypothetical protein
MADNHRHRAVGPIMDDPALDNYGLLMQIHEALHLPALGIGLPGRETRIMLELIVNDTNSMANLRNHRFISHERDLILQAGFAPDAPAEAYAARERTRLRRGNHHSSENLFANTSLEEDSFVPAGSPIRQCRSQEAEEVYHSGPSYGELVAFHQLSCMKESASKS